MATLPSRRRKPNVLVVDDLPANRLALDAVLGDEHNLIHLDSGRAAIDFLARPEGIDVILMDVQMPGMDGFEAASLIKKMPGCEEIPIVFVTAVYKEDPFVKQGYQAGGIDYFGKPFDPDILRMKVSVYASFRQKSALLRERERHVRESEELLRVGRKLSTMLESLDVGVLIADIEGRICQTTREASHILKSPEAPADDAYRTILGWWDRDGRMIKDQGGPLGRALKEGVSSHSEPIEIRCVDGSRKTIVASASPLRGLDDRPVGAVVLIQDLTEGRQIEEDLELRVNRLISTGLELEESGAAAR